MVNVKRREISTQGIDLLSDPILRAVLSEVVSELGITAEEYLLRFEQVLLRAPEKIFAVFEN